MNPKYQVNGLFEIPAETWEEAIQILKDSKLKPVDIRIYEIKILDRGIAQLT